MVTAAYDAAGEITSFTDASGASLSFARNSDGSIAGISDSTGASLSMTYDAAGTQLESTSGAFGTTSFAYGADGDLSGIDRPGSPVAVTYDAEGRLAGINIGKGAQTESYVYDNVGGYTVTDGAGNSATVALLPGDIVGRVTDSSGNADSLLLSQQGEVTGAENANGAIQNFTYDSAGRMTSITDANGATVIFGYSGTSVLPSSFTDADGSTRSFTYDSSGRITGATWPDGTTLSFQYDAAGNLTSFTNRNGDTTTYTYDSAGHETSASDSPAGATNYTYDLLGRLISAVTAEGSTTIAYDSAGRVSEISYPGGYSLSYTYDAAGRRTSMVDQDGHSQTYTYDAAGRLATLGDENGVLVTYSYDAAGNLIRQTNANSTATTYAYDESGGVTSITNLAPDGSVSSFEDYAYDAAGLTTSMATQDGRWVYGYDADGQLTSADFTSTNPNVANKSLAYTYDSAGNRVSSTEDGVTTTYTRNALNQYTQVGDATFTYDAAGNMVSRTDPSGTTTFAYDTDNRLTSVTAADGTVTSYEYDVFGDRIAQVVNGVRTTYLVDPFGLGNVVAEYGADGALMASYAQGLGLAAQIGADGSTDFYQSDAVGSVTGLTDGAGSVVDNYAYTPFGTTLYANGAVDNGYQFDGTLGVSKEAAGLLAMRARDYDPQTASFTSQDPLFMSGDVENLYRFADNNPISGADPSGDVIFLIAAAILEGLLEGGLVDAGIGGLGATIFEGETVAVSATAAREEIVASRIVGEPVEVGEGGQRLFGKLLALDYEFQNPPGGIDLSPLEGALANWYYGYGFHPNQVYFDTDRYDDPNKQFEHILPWGAPSVTVPLQQKPPIGGACATASGCPHFTTYDGLHFDFQGAGEFVAAKSTVAGDNFQVQMRIEPEFSADSSVSIITQIGIQVGSHRVTFGVPQSFDAPRPQVVWVDGAPAAIDQTDPVLTLDGGTVTEISSNDYRVALNTGEVVTVNPFGDGMGFSVSLPEDAAAGSVQGFLGPDDGQANDFQLPDGTVLQQPLTQDQLYHQFADAWRVTDSNSLLDYAQGQTTATFTNTQYPREILTLADFPPDLVARAAALAAAAGITDPTLAADAEFDYITMGNPNYFSEDAIVASENPATPTAAGITDHTAPPPSLGALPTAPQVLESAGATTPVTFTINLTSAATTDTIVDYSVVPGGGVNSGKDYLTAADFGGALPTGSVTIAAGGTQADITIDVPNSAIGSAASKWLMVSVSSEGDIPVYDPTGQAEILNNQPVAGSPAEPAIQILASATPPLTGNGETLTKAGNTYTVDLGNVLTGTQLSALQFAIANAASPPADSLMSDFSGGPATASRSRATCRPERSRREARTRTSFSSPTPRPSARTASPRPSRRRT